MPCIYSFIICLDGYGFGFDFGLDLDFWEIGVELNFCMLYKNLLLP